MSADGQFTTPHRPPRQAPDTGASTLAWLTLVMGIGSWIFLPFLGALAAVVCGLIERRKIAEGSSSPQGSSMVTVGLIFGGAQVVIAILAIVAMLFFFALMFLGILVA